MTKPGVCILIVEDYWDFSSLELFMLCCCETVISSRRMLLLPLLSLSFTAHLKELIIIALVGVFLIGVLLPEAWILSGHSFPHRPDTHGGNYWVENFQWLKYWYATAVFFWETTLLLLLFGLLLGKIFIQKKKTLTNRQFTVIIIVGFVVGIASYLALNIYPARIASLPDIGNTHIIRATRIHTA